MNFGRISERLMKLAVSMNYLKLMRLFLHLFTVLQCQRRAIPTFRRTDRFHSRAYGGLLCKFRGAKGSFYLRKAFSPQRIFSIHQHGRRFFVLYTNMAAVTSCDNDL